MVITPRDLVRLLRQIGGVVKNPTRRSKHG
jgi:hypothetical protein